MFWQSAVDDAVITVDAIPARGSRPDVLDIRDAGVETVILLRDGREQALLRQGSRTIRIDVRSGTLTAGPVYLRYALAGFERLEAQLLTLRRLAALWRLGRMPAALFPPQRRAARWSLVLRTIDALEVSASYRDIAEGLFGASAVEREWRGRTDYLRLRIQRLARAGRHLIEGGYLELLRTRATPTHPVSRNAQ